MSKEELSKLIYDQLQTEFTNENGRVSNPASEYNQRHSDRLASAIVDYLDRRYWERIVAYVEPIRQTAIQALSLPAPGSGPPGPPGPPGPAGHTDTYVPLHVDAAPHTDTPHADTPHTDDVYPPAHGDTTIVHSDTVPHNDVRHLDTEIVPHIDGYTPHVDIGGGGGGGENSQIQFI